MNPFKVPTKCKRLLQLRLIPVHNGKGERGSPSSILSDYLFDDLFSCHGIFKKAKVEYGGWRLAAGDQLSKKLPIFQTSFLHPPFLSYAFEREKHVLRCGPYSL